MKSSCSTIVLPQILPFLDWEKVTGTDGVAVKCIDIIQNANCEGR